MRYLYKALERISQSIFTQSSRNVEYILATFATVWGFWVLYPGHDSFSPPSGYRALLTITSEPAWGLVVFSIGIIQFILLFLPTDRKYIKTGRKASLVAEFFIWTTVAISFLVTSTSTAVPVYSVIAAITALTMVKVGFNE